MTLPANLEDLPNMFEVLTDRGDVPEDLYRCACKRELPPKSFACTDDIGPGLPRFLCFTCASGPFREARAQEEAQAQAQLAAWDTERGKACKVERDRRIDKSLWTTSTGSPLTASCRRAWRDWRIKMNRLTLDLAEPIASDSPLWPEEPGYEYVQPEETP